MSIDVETKDTTHLSDAEIAEMADLCASGAIAHEVGSLSKATESWVLVTRARSGPALEGFTLSTLERLGGTPCVLIGMAEVRRNPSRPPVVGGLIGENLRRAAASFPDEHVLVAARFCTPLALEAFASLDGVVPRDGHRASGEERAWGRRLAKRFGARPRDYADRNFVIRGDGDLPLVFDHESADPARTAAWHPFFDGVDTASGDSLLVFGWARAEVLQQYDTERPG